MGKRKKYFGLLAVPVACLLVGCGGVGGRTLNVGVKDDVANFGLYDEESGRYSGMEIDLAQMLAEDLGYSGVEYVTVDATTRETMIDSGELDLVIATYSITNDRKEKYDFSTPYYTDHAAVMVENSSMITELEGLKDCRIGTLTNSSNTKALAVYMARQGIIPKFNMQGFSPDSFKEGVQFAEYDSYSEISDALEYGDVDAFVADRSILGGYVGEDRTILPDSLSEQDYGVCTKKGSALSQKVDEAIQRRLEDGTIADLIDKWGN